MRSNAGSGTIYALGLLGAIIYFIQNAQSFGEGLIGVLLSFIWPGVLVYKALELLGM